MLLGNNLVRCETTICGNFEERKTVYFILTCYLLGFTITSVIIFPLLFCYSIGTLSVCIITTFSYILAILFYILSYVGDPGIIPKNYPQYTLSKNAFIDTDIIMKEFYLKQQNKEPQGFIINNSKDVKEEEIDQTKRIVPQIYTERECNTCNIMRPPKASHCRKCDNCVMNYDQ